MSQNHNNIYSILGKLESLTPKEVIKESAPSLKEYAQVPARGSVLEGVDAIEAKLKTQFSENTMADEGNAFGNAVRRAKADGIQYGEKIKVGGHEYPVKEEPVDEVTAPGQEDWVKSNKQRFIKQYGHDKGLEVLYATAWKRHHAANESAECSECGMEESACTCLHEESGSGKSGSAKSGKVYRHKGTYGNEYDPGDDDEKKPKKTVNKGVKGRPKKERPPEYKAPKGDIFGRTTGKVPKGEKGTEIKGKAMSHPMNKKDEARIMEGVNFAEMVKRKHQSVDEMLAELQADIKTFKETGSCSDLLRDCMEVVSYGKEQIADEAITRPSPTDIKFATPAVQRKAAAPAGDNSWMINQGDLDQKERETPTTHAGLQQRKQDLGLAEELDELAKLAGLDVSESKNKKPDDDKDGIPNWADKNPKKKGGDEDRIEECMSPMGSAPTQPSRFNVSTNISSDGNKNVTVTADGEEAEALMKLLTMAGLGGGEQAPRAEVVAVAEASKEYSDTDVEEVEDLANSPKEAYGTIDQQIEQGDDMHRQKKQFKKEYPGDNPMAVESVLSLEARLAAEYESIKKVSK